MSAAAQYSRPLQRKLGEAGLQGCVDAGGFKRLLQYAEDVQGSLDKVHEILALLKSSESRLSCPSGRLCSGRTVCSSFLAAPLAVSSIRAAAQRQVFNTPQHHPPHQTWTTPAPTTTTASSRAPTSRPRSGSSPASSRSATSRLWCRRLRCPAWCTTRSASGCTRTAAATSCCRRRRCGVLGGERVGDCCSRSGSEQRSWCCPGALAVCAGCSGGCKRLYNRARPHAPPISTRVQTQDKHKLYLNRYNLLLQRLRRNRRFQPPNPLQAAAGAAPQAQLTELMGLKGNAGETCIVMGIIGSQEDGHLAIEDVGAKVPLDLSEAKLASGFLTGGWVLGCWWVLVGRGVGF